MEGSVAYFTSGAGATDTASFLGRGTNLVKTITQTPLYNTGLKGNHSHDPLPIALSLTIQANRCKHLTSVIKVSGRKKVGSTKALRLEEERRQTIQAICEFTR